MRRAIPSLQRCHQAAAWGQSYACIKVDPLSSPQCSTSSSRAGCRLSSSTTASIPWQQQDQIVLKGMTFHGYHGALPEENVLGQKFVVDATLWADLAAAGRSDNLQDTIDYSKAYSTIQAVVQGPPRALQEAVAEDVAQQLLLLDARVSAVQVYIRKPHVALSGVLDSVGIQLFRTRT